MGGGGDGRPVRESFLKKSFSIDKLPSLSDIKQTVQSDFTVLRHMWFSKASGGDDAARLESFYGPQAEACECQRLKVA